MLAFLPLEMSINSKSVNKGYFKSLSFSVSNLIKNVTLKYSDILERIPDQITSFF